MAVAKTKKRKEPDASVKSADAGSAEDVEVDPIDARVAGHCQFFARMFELIPAQYYFKSDPEPVPSKYTHNKKRAMKDGPKQSVKEATKKAKKAKLDPSQQKSNRELLLQGSEFENDIDAGASSGNDSGMDGLKQRLEARVHELRKQRVATAHRKLGAKGQQAKEQKAAKKLEAAAGPKKKRKKKPAQSEGAEGGVVAGTLAGAAEASGVPLGQDYQFAAAPGKSTADTHRTNSRKKSDVKLLKQAQHFESRLADTEPELRKEITEDAAWGTAMNRAQGVKVKNDVALLKKSIKRKEKSVEKSRKGWEKRLSDGAKVEKDKAKREDKKKQWRLENKGKKKGSKPGSNARKARPGFEGKKIAA